MVKRPKQTNDINIEKSADKRFIYYEVPSDYMRPSLEPGDRVEIDTSVTQAHYDGIYLFQSPQGDPELRVVQVRITTGMLRIFCPRDAGTKSVEDCDPNKVVILGRARRYLRETWLWGGG